MPPTDPITEQLVEKIVARLEAIQEGETYWYTPLEVARDYKFHTDVKGFPFYGVIDDEKAAEGEDNQDIHDLFTVTIVGWVKSDQDRRLTVRRAISDVERAIYSDETWDGLAIWTEYPSTRTDRAALIAKPFAYFEMTLAIHYDHGRKTT